MSFDNLKNSFWRSSLARRAFLILWIGVIFFLSSGQGSMSNTSRFIGPLLHFLFPDSSAELLLVYHNFIRKFAHFAEYAVLAFFAFRAFSSAPQKFLQRFWFPVSLLLVFTIASLDEFNQSFLASRTSSFRDVLLDTLGGTAMLVFLLLFTKFRKNPAMNRK